MKKNDGGPPPSRSSRHHHHRQTLFNSNTISLLILFSLTLTSSLSLVTAIDRSKFRTCAQTSFCRRQRHGRSSPEYHYRLLPDSIRFHKPPIETPPKTNADDPAAESTGDASAGAAGDAAAAVGEPEPSPKKGGILASLGRMLYTSPPDGSNGVDSTGVLDPYVRGPDPFFTAALINTAPDRYSAGDGDSDRDALALSIYLLEDGVARVRITERYSVADGDGGSKPYSRARWTSDELILNWEEMTTSYDDVEVLGLGGNEGGDEGDALVARLLGQLPTTVDSSEADTVVFRYGGGKKDDRAGGTASLILVRFHPFALHMWRDGEEDGPPIVSVNEDNLMHFETRRVKIAGEDGDKGNSDGIPDLGGDDDEITDDDLPFDDEGNPIIEDTDAQQEEDVHGGKEITGYWEDGLAIYADGSREERKDDTPNDPNTDTERKLQQEKMTTPTPTQQKYAPDTEGLWDEKFSSHHDSKPHGPTGVGSDIQFPHSTHLFGLPEHASGMRLRTTIGGEGSHYKEPYRLYNLDVFEYELDETMALYGEVPLIIGQGGNGGTVGVFWFNPSETFVDVDANETGDSTATTKTHWISESGVLDIFLLPGPDPKAMYRQYARLTGRMPLPPMFALGYHQCRWNYRDEEDVYAVHGKFEELDYPYDVLWLDIEHTDDKRYFTWDKGLFPNPIGMQETLKSQGRNMVTIVDPHIKRDNNYYIHKKATNLGLYIKDKDGSKDYDGWCWPGSSSYLDFTSERVRSWWADQFAYHRYLGSTPSLYTWNDMNEPSVFNGPEVSMQKDLQNLDGVEHREWHNLYGILFQRATAEGLVRRNEGENVRPFVLSRSFFAGSQKYGAIWTGDNESSWPHLKIATPMLLSLNSAALSFVGADVGGFFGNPDAELMTRWMQAGAYTPFFRGHAHHDSKRREPWIFGHEWMIRMRRAAIARYALLPYWYTLFREAGVTGMPVMRAMWMQYPKVESLYGLDDQYLVGSDLLVKPITDAGATRTHIIFPTTDTWYDVDTMTKVPLPPANNGDDSNATEFQRDITIDTIPVYQRGGSVISRKLRLRRSTETMVRDPYTLYVALDSELRASGELYMDDERSFDHENEKKHYGLAQFSVDWKGGSGIRNEVSTESDWAKDDGLQRDRMVERIVVMGVEEEPKGLTLESTELDFDYDSRTNVLVVRKPLVSALGDWEILIVV